jgi:hypothetical protein
MAVHHSSQPARNGSNTQEHLMTDIRIDLSEPGVVRLVDPDDLVEIRRLAAENTRRAAERRAKAGF